MNDVSAPLTRHPQVVDDHDDDAADRDRHENAAENVIENGSVIGDGVDENDDADESVVNRKRRCLW